MPRSYTRTGDDGTTGRFGGRRMDKHHPLLETLGALDEACAAVGLGRALLGAHESTPIGKQNDTKQLSRSDLPRRSDLNERLREVQDMLFRVGADLSTPLDHPTPPAARITAQDTAALEAKIDALDTQLPALRQFILPGGSEAAAALHLARAVVRRAERNIVCAEEYGETLNPALKPFLNRLSSYLFALARYANSTAGIAEEHPRYT